MVVEGRVEIVSRDKESRKSAKDGIVPPRLVCIVSGYIYTEAVVVKGPSVPGCPEKLEKDLCKTLAIQTRFLRSRKKSPLAFSQARDNRLRAGRGSRNGEGWG